MISLSLRRAQAGVLHRAISGIAHTTRPLRAAMPSVDSEVTVQLDFKQLYEEVAQRGGSVEVVKNHKWVEIAVALIKDAGGFNKKPREEQRRAAMSMSHYFKKYLQRTEQNARGLARDPVRTTRWAVVKQEPGTGHYQQQQELEPAELDLEATKHLWKSRKMVPPRRRLS